MESATGALPLPSMSVPPSMASVAGCDACADMNDTAIATPNNAPTRDLLTFSLRNARELQTLWRVRKDPPSRGRPPEPILRHLRKWRDHRDYGDFRIAALTDIF